MNTIHLRALSSSQVTVLSNIFIDQYMPGAGGEFVKVYIYLLRLLADPSASVCLPLLADRLNCTEGDISRALKYWSNEGLLILETDPSGELTGITLTEPSPDTQMELKATVSVPSVCTGSRCSYFADGICSHCLCSTVCTGSHCSYFTDGICSHCFHATAGYCTVQICLCSHPSPNQGA